MISALNIIGGTMVKRKGFKKNNTPKNLILLTLILILVISILIIIFKLWDKNKDNNEINEIIERNSENLDESERITKLKELQKENSEIVAWIEIENSNVNYPVLQDNDNSFYMTHNYKKEYSKEGSIFLDKDYDWNIPSTNLLLYGHNNVGNNEMFADLIKYKDEEYYKTHKTVRFTTTKEDAEYEIISVFLSRVYYKSEKNVFRYYYFLNANNENEFNEYIANSKKASLYNIESSAEYGDQLLTLSTCEYSQKDGRLAVVAKKLNNK